MYRLNIERERGVKTLEGENVHPRREFNIQIMATNQPLPLAVRNNFYGNGWGNFIHTRWWWWSCHHDGDDDAEKEGKFIFKTSPRETKRWFLPCLLFNLLSLSHSMILIHRSFDRSILSSSSSFSSTKILFFIPFRSTVEFA